MKLSYVVFQFVKYHHPAYRVIFDPESSEVTVYDSDAIWLLTVDNKSGEYKPCVTHATEILKLALRKPATSNFAKRRSKVMKPQLKVRK